MRATPLAAWPAYDLTTIRQPVNRMVEATTEAILGLIEGTARPQKTFIDGPLMSAARPGYRKVGPHDGLFEPLERFSRLHPRHHEADLGRP
jgi:hypothetical protein